jgi:2,4-dienoyl-CoA reductase-like NADH-dependent reductase (Old Yellow Enzyme family)/thioredoxin reductase
MNYNSLFTPFKIGSMELKNRVVLSPMGTNSGNIDGTISEDEIDYFVERAKGGTGLIIMGCQFLNEELAQGSMEGVLKNNYVLPKLTTLCESVHLYGGKIAAQISCGTGRNAFPSMYGEPPVSSSAIPATLNPELTCHPLTVEEIKGIMEQFYNSATIAKKAGFDAIEVHAHAGYLIDQFMSPVWNIREDEYGGSPENRMRFAVEIVRSIRKAVGNTTPILFRIALDHRFEGGRTLEDSMELIKILEKEGVDAFDIDAGSYETIEYIFPPSYLGDACMEYVCAPARKAVKVPILNSGNHTPETAVRLLESGNADLVMFGRPLIADPYLPAKLEKGLREDVRPCIRCNEDCIGRIVTRSTKLSCSVNPQACEEKRFAIKPSLEKKKVVVIGGGPGGLEAAHTAAIRGHEVTLYEKNAFIGGQLAAAATPSFKAQLASLVDWYSIQLKKLGVTVNLSTEITADSKVLEECDQIIVATGAVPLTPPIKGIDGSNVINVIDAHMNHEAVKGDNIVICGGGLSGCDCALELAMDKGIKNVTIVEMKDAIASELMFITAAGLMSKIKEYGIKLKTSCKVLSIDAEGVHIEDAEGNQSLLPADTVITAFGMRSEKQISEKIKEKYHSKTRSIGDCSQVSKVGAAIRTGFFAAMGME